MKSKERVLSAVNFTQPDRIPMSLGTNSWVRRVLYKTYGLKNQRDLLKYPKWLNSFQKPG